MISSHGGELVFRITLASGVLESIAVGLRLTAQWKNNQRFYNDDWWIVASLVPSYGMLTIGMLMVTIGRAGNPGATLTPSEVILFLKTTNASLIAYALTITMVKISILLLYRRVFDVRKCRIATTVLLGVCIFWGIAAMFVLVFQCQPMAGMWNPADMFTSKCIDIKAYYAGIAGSNMGLDIIILATPIYMVWGYNGTGLRLKTSQKLMLTGVFLLGGLVCVASLLRIITVQFIKGADLPYTVITAYIWSQIEPTTAIICASITTYRPLFRDLSFRPLSHTSWFSSSSANRSRSSSHVNSPVTALTPGPVWPGQPQHDHRFVVDRFQDFIFNIPSDPSSGSRTRPVSISNHHNNEPVLGIYEEMIKRRAALTYGGEKNSGNCESEGSERGSEKASRAGSWLKSQSSDDGVDRG